ncbi:hypothetical protein FQR65_LT06250 [Abscondita terminalis]|nr:hypothetical protein FQR65_LT06250 [Abscondita terminalis]
MFSFVTGVGMIPVKDRNSDLLTWHIISDGTSSTRSSPQLSDKIHDTQINIMIAPRTKLGCGICKGPEWKPGIFVQFTKEGGIAREVGLRPGDQILSCNNIDFNDIQFNEAVNIMKSARQLDLHVRKSAGSELFPGESSGYNSSASSVTGDQSPSWSDLKRLSIVKEESLELEDRLSQLDRFKTSKWNKMEWDDIDSDKRYQFRPTIINLSENGTTITNSSSDECQKIETNCNTLTRTKSNQLDSVPEPKTVFVEVHQKKEPISTKTDTSCVFGTLKSTDSSSSLSSAISQELRRRSERKKIETKPPIDEQLHKQKILKGVDACKQEQHSKLMDEFKKVHRKMFKTTDDEKPLDVEKSLINNELSDRQNRLKPIENRPVHETLQEKLPARHSTPALDLSPPPPPPPPPPFDSNSNIPQDVSKPKAKTAPPVPIKYSTLSYAREHPVDYYQPPPCPTPDYDTISLSSNYSKSTFSRSNSSTSQNDAIEMDSIDSVILNNPSTFRPKQPNTYFKTPLSSQLSNGSTTSTSTIGSRKQRPISVTIGEYPSGSLRKQPGRLDFLNNVNGDVEKKSGGGPISTQLASELAHTLSRSNLRKRTESMENMLNNPQIQSQSNGSVTISLSNGVKNYEKSDTNYKSGDNKSNRVTISICSMDKKLDVPNGILKNGNGNHNFHNTNHKTLVQQKSITFGEM